MSTTALQQAPAGAITELDLPRIEQEIKARAGMITENIVYIGQRLIEVKGSLPHGQFATWLADKVQFSQSTAGNFMRIAREMQAEPALLRMNLPYTKALALLDVPADKREAFIEEHKPDELSVREIQRLTKELEEKDRLVQRAREETQTARFATGRAQEMAAQYNDQLQDEIQRAELALQALEKARTEVKTEVVVVPPEDYEQLKERATQADALVREAESYAAEQEAQRQKLQAELRRLKEAKAGMDARTGVMEAAGFGKTVQGFIAECGSLPHMAGFFTGLTEADRALYTQWVDALQDWLYSMRGAMGYAPAPAGTVE